MSNKEKTFSFRATSNMIKALELYAERRDLKPSEAIRDMIRQTEEYQEILKGVKR